MDTIEVYIYCVAVASDQLGSVSRISAENLIRSIQISSTELHKMYTNQE